MLVTNLTIFSYFLKNTDYPVPAGGSLEIDDALWASDDELARTIESLDNFNYVSVVDRPDNYPRTREFPQVINIIGDQLSPPVPVHTHEVLNGPTTGQSIPYATSTALTLTDSSGPDTLLDLSQSNRPKFITAGVYSISVTVMPAPTSGGNTTMVPGTGFLVNLDLDNEGDYAVIGHSGASPGTMEVTIAATYYFPANHSFSVRLQHFDNSGSKDFKIDQAVIQRIS